MIVSCLLAFWMAVVAPAEEESGLVVVVPDQPRRVTQLHDEGGGNEKPPSWMLEAAAGTAHVDFMAASPAAFGAASVFFRPAGDWWTGLRISGGAGRRRNPAGALREGGADVEVRRYFMLHPEANRFVMGYAGVAAGVRFLDADGETLAGPAFSLTAGVGAALSYDRYVGIQLGYALPVWLHNDTQPREYASFFSVTLFFTKGF